MKYRSDRRLTQHVQARTSISAYPLFCISGVKKTNERILSEIRIAVY